MLTAPLEVNFSGGLFQLYDDNLSENIYFKTVSTKW